MQPYDNTGTGYQPGSLRPMNNQTNGYQPGNLQPMNNQSLQYSQPDIPDLTPQHAEAISRIYNGEPAQKVLNDFNQATGKNVRWNGMDNNNLYFINSDGTPSSMPRTKAATISQLHINIQGQQFKRQKDQQEFQWKQQEFQNKQQDQQLQTAKSRMLDTEKVQQYYESELGKSGDYNPADLYSGAVNPKNNAPILSAKGQIFHDTVFKLKNDPQTAGMSDAEIAQRAAQQAGLPTHYSRLQRMQTANDALYKVGDRLLNTKKYDAAKAERDAAAADLATSEAYRTGAQGQQRASTAGVDAVTVPGTGTAGQVGQPAAANPQQLEMQKLQITKQWLDTADPNDPNYKPTANAYAARLAALKPQHPMQDKLDRQNYQAQGQLVAIEQQARNNWNNPKNQAELQYQANRNGEPVTTDRYGKLRPVYPWEGQDSTQDVGETGIRQPEPARTITVDQPKTEAQIQEFMDNNGLDQRYTEAGANAPGVAQYVRGELPLAAEGPSKTSETSKKSKQPGTGTTVGQPKTLPAAVNSAEELQQALGGKAITLLDMETYVQNGGVLQGRAIKQYSQARKNFSKQRVENTTSDNSSMQPLPENATAEQRALQQIKQDTPDGTVPGMPTKDMFPQNQSLVDMREIQRHPDRFTQNELRVMDGRTQHEPLNLRPMVESVDWAPEASGQPSTVGQGGQVGPVRQNEITTANSRLPANPAKPGLQAAKAQRGKLQKMNASDNLGIPPQAAHTRTADIAASIARQGYDVNEIMDPATADANGDVNYTIGNTSQKFKDALAASEAKHPELPLDRHVNVALMQSGAKFIRKTQGEQQAVDTALQNRARMSREKQSESSKKKADLYDAAGKAVNAVGQAANAVGQATSEEGVPGLKLIPAASAAVQGYKLLKKMMPKRGKF